MRCLCLYNDCCFIELSGLFLVMESPLVSICYPDCCYRVISPCYRKSVQTMSSSLPDAADEERGGAQAYRVEESFTIHLVQCPIDPLPIHTPRSLSISPKTRVKYSGTPGPAGRMLFMFSWFMPWAEQNHVHPPWSHSTFWTHFGHEVMKLMKSQTCTRTHWLCFLFQVPRWRRPITCACCVLTPWIFVDTKLTQSGKSLYIHIVNYLCCK
jgi:hypothetical protein